MPGPQDKKEHEHKGTKICYDNPNYHGSGKLKDKVALIAGGAGGIGRSVAIFFAREGADIALVYLKDDEEASQTKKYVEAEGRKCHIMSGDLSDCNFVKRVVDETMHTFKKIDILVNHVGTATTTHRIEDLTEEQFDHTMKTNVYSFFFLTKCVVPHLKEGSCIINTSSTAAHCGDCRMLDYATSKGSVKAWTYSLAKSLAERNIRVNAVAPGLVVTPMTLEGVGNEGLNKMAQRTMMGRVGHPCECAPAYVFLASQDSSYVTGQTIHCNGGITMSS